MIMSALKQTSPHGQIITVNELLACPMTKHSPSRCFKTSPEIIRLAVMCVRFPLSLRNIEDLLHERGIGICH